MAQHVARFHMHIDHDIPDMGYEKHGHPRNGGLCGLPDDSFCTFRSLLIYWLYPHVWLIHVDLGPLVISLYPN